MNSSSRTPAHDGLLTPLAALSDNYIWMVQKNGRAMVVDPGESEPVLHALHAQGLTLDSILLTHHHGDHVGGVLALQKETGAYIYGPRHETLPACDTTLVEGDTVTLPALDLQFNVLDIPGHTAGHIAYAGDLLPGLPAVFCGDTLFAAGCGRLFEGTPAQMLDSLDKIARLPARSLVCCAHEYTQSNLRWALAVDPDNAALQERARDTDRLRAAGRPSVPTALDLELRTNPFLRSRDPGIRAAAQAHAGQVLRNAVDVFAALRAWKDDFR